MNVEECPKCHKPKFPFASRFIQTTDKVCVCDIMRKDVMTAYANANRATIPVQTPKQAKGVPDLEQLYLDILAEYAPELPKPLRQQEVIPGRGYTVDFYFPAQRLVVEIDGNVHRIKTRFQSDAEKNNLLVLAGYVYLRFTGHMLRKQVARVVEWTREGLERAGK